MKVSRVEVVPLRVPIEEAHGPHVSVESIFPAVGSPYSQRAGNACSAKIMQRFFVVRELGFPKGDTSNLE